MVFMAYMACMAYDKEEGSLLHSNFVFHISNTMFMNVYACVGVLVTMSVINSWCKLCILVACLPSVLALSDCQHFTCLSLHIYCADFILCFVYILYCILYTL